MKKFFIVFCSFLIGTALIARDPGIDERLIRSFTANFPNAKNVVWSEQPTAYAVSFTEDGIRARLIYGKDAEFVSITRYYTQEKLPVHVLLKVKENYTGKKIFGIIEFTKVQNQVNQLIVEYYLKLEDNTHWYTVKMDTDGELKVVEKYRKVL